MLTADKDFDAFVMEGGWPQIAPQVYAQLTNQYMDRIRSKQQASAVAGTLSPQIDALERGRNAVVASLHFFV